MIRFTTRRALACAFLTTIALPSAAFAQLVPPAPVRQSVDENGVDLLRGTVSVDAPALTIGGSDNGLSYHKLARGFGWTDNLIASLNLDTSTVTVSLGGKSDRFTVSGSSYISTEGRGSTLTFDSTSNVYTYMR